MVTLVEHQVIKVNEFSGLKSANELTFGAFSLGCFGCKRGRNINIHLDVHLALLAVVDTLALKLVQNPL